MKKRHKHKSSGLSFFQFSLLQPVIQPESKPAMNPAGVILAAKQAFIAAGWTPAQSRAETRPKGGK